MSENRAGQAKNAVAADVAGPTSTAGTAGTPADDEETTTAEVPVHETAGPLGAHYVTGADGKPVAVESSAQPPVEPGEAAQAPMAVADVSTTEGPRGEPRQTVEAVREVIAAEPSVPVVANPGPPSDAPDGAKVAHAKPDAEE